jgi:hypothetical protein
MGIGTIPRCCLSPRKAATDESGHAALSKRRRAPSLLACPRTTFKQARTVLIEIYSEVDTDVLQRGWRTLHLQNLTKGVPINLGGPEYTVEDAELLACIRAGDEPLCNFQEAAKTNFVIDAIYDSVNTGEMQSVHYGV